jgi:hypothetical protein
MFSLPLAEGVAHLEAAGRTQDELELNSNKTVGLKTA